MKSYTVPTSIAALVLGVCALNAGAATGPSDAPHRAASVARAAAARRYVTAPAGNSARYFVREQLASISFPSDAIGVTDGITGQVVLDASGHLVADSSKFVADVSRLKSDRDMRDGYIKRRTLETDRFPTVQLVLRELRGIPDPLPDSGRVTFTLVGDLTVHGVTRPTTWSVTAGFRNGAVRGTASTGFTFDDFGIAKPRVFSVMSVADSIHLVYDFNLVPADGGSVSSGR